MKQSVPSLPVTRDSQTRLTAQYAAYRSAQIANVDYVLDITLPDDQAQFGGLSSLSFDVRHLNAPVTVDFNAGTVVHVAVNGRSVPVEYNGAYVTLAPATLVLGRNTVDIGFRHAYGRDGAGLHRFDDPEDGRSYLFTHFEPYDANRMFPCFDQPDLKASFSLRVLAPAGWHVISAMPESQISGAAAADFQGMSTGSGTAMRYWEFAPSPRFSTYLFALHAGPYTQWRSQYRDTPLALFARQSLARYVDAEQWFDLTRRGLEFFNDWFAIDYPYSKYDQVVVPGLNIGAMENTAAVTFNEHYVSRGTQTRQEAEALADVLLHEMSHMWFGNLVTMEWWDGLWLKESFATYMSHVAAVQATQHKDMWRTFFARDKQRAYRADQRVTTHPIDVPVDDTRDAFTHFDSITYNKGASVLKQLAHYVGEDQFQAGVQRYLNKHAGGTTRLADFVAALSAAADTDLEHWSDSWLNTAGLNTLTAQVQCRDGVVETLQVAQSAPQDLPTLRAHRVQVGLYRVTGSGEIETIAVLPTRVDGALTIVDGATGLRCPDLVYPNAQDWGFASIALDAITVTNIQKHIGAVTDPLSRAMFWQSLWDTVRDAKMPLPDYFDLAIRELPAESDAVVAALVLGHVSEGMQSMKRALPASAAMLNRFAPALETLMWSRIEAAHSDNNARMLWFDHYLHIAHTSEALERLLTLTALPATPAGVTLDSRRRWDVLIKLSGYGMPDLSPRIDAGLRRDGSELAARKAAATDAARPLSEVKTHWLSRLAASDDTLTLSQAREVMNALFPAHQSTLAQAHADAVLAPLTTLPRQRNDAYLRAWNQMLPRLCRTSGVALLSRTLQSSGGLHPETVKALKETRQEEQICAAMLALVGIDADRLAP